jgi:tetratricopeptide (TPR) repeat protein
MRQFIKANGETTERLYLLSSLCTGGSREDDSVAALQRILAIMPDHAGANNDLGYFWVNAGIHLDQAGPMIRKALEDKPDDPAFLDSLGWFYYKSGRFDEARKLLEKALSMPDGLSPEVIQHLADTLYRQGHSQEAIQHWAAALQLLELTSHLNPNDLKVKDYVSKALTEARAGRTPALSPIVEASPVKSADSH